MTAPAGGLVPVGPLHTVSIGTAGSRIAFLHGLFGQGRNWSQIAKAVAWPDGNAARGLLVDLPDHGRSPWSHSFSYAGSAAAVAATLAAAAPSEPWTLVGHSLGGKVAMLTALQHPELIERVCVVDIAPKSYHNLHRFAGYIHGMQALPLAELTSRADAEVRFAQVEPDPGIRAFLLQNLRREGTTWRWAVNLELIAADAARGAASAIADFPVPEGVSAFPGPAVWLVGGNSEYVRDHDAVTMRELFPQVRKVTVKGAGHWVHTDAPAVVIDTLRQLLNAH
ncbi:alpha/beta fold hydrolase [Nostocoides sp.]|uniref:alpha/beta fold hydrolase n=1 Tax=Nostocoides sp. TaxID=1917966 RepID=UPI002B707604|nr:alpha/beta fold hydrolase [Tetrasphaera sp.]